jgi:hypothetical protein
MSWAQVCAHAVRIAVSTQADALIRVGAIQLVDVIVRSSCDKRRGASVPTVHDLLDGFRGELQVLVSAAHAQWRTLSTMWLWLYVVMTSALETCTGDERFRCAANVNWLLEVMEARGREVPVGRLLTKPEPCSLGEYAALPLPVLVQSQSVCNC